MYYFVTILCVSLVLFPSFPSYAALNGNELQDEIQKVNDENTAKPTGDNGAPGVGYIGSIIQQLFFDYGPMKGKIHKEFLEIIDATGKIANSYLHAFDNFSSGDANVVPKWDGSNLTPSAIAEKNGNVGIGTQDPINKLHISASNAQGVLIDATGNEGPSVSFKNSAKRNVRDSVADTWKIYNMTGRYGNGLQFWSYDGNANNRLTLSDRGNVGIGTQNPLHKLEVNSGVNDAVANFISSDQNAFIRISQNNNISQRIELANRGGSRTALWNPNTGDVFNIVHSIGNVGIGTTSPTQKLEIRGGVKITSHILDGNNRSIRDGNGGWVRTYGDTGWFNGTHGGGWYMNDSTWIRSYGNKKVYINNDIVSQGRVGIGTSSPTQKLDVRGNSYISGNLGVGTLSPSNKLEVAGNVEANAYCDRSGRCFDFRDLKDIQDFLNRRWYTVGAASGLYNYTGRNTKGYPIEVAAYVGGNRCNISIYIDGSLRFRNINNNDEWSKVCGGSITVPPGSYYKVSGDGYVNRPITKLSELR